MENPIVRAFVLADRVYVERGTNKFVIAGTFNRINSSRFPTSWVAGATVYYAITSFRKSGKIELVFREASTSSEIFKMEGQVVVRQEDPLGVVEGALAIPPFPLNHPGTYEFVLLFEGAPLAFLPLQVAQV